MKRFIKPQKYSQKKIMDKMVIIGMNAKEANKLYREKLQKRLIINGRIAKIFMPLVYRRIKKECLSRHNIKRCCFKTLRRYAYIFELFFDIHQVQNMMILILEEKGFSCHVMERKWRKSREDYTIFINW